MFLRTYLKKNNHFKASDSCSDEWEISVGQTYADLASEMHLQTRSEISKAKKI